MPNFILGKNAKAYFSTTLSTAATEAAIATALGTGTEATNIQDLDSGGQKDTIEISSRENAQGFKQKVASLKDATVTFNILWKPADAFFIALKDSWLNDTEVFFAGLDQAKTVVGTSGIAGNWQVSNFSRKEPLNGALTVDVELIPSSFTSYYTKSS